MKNVSNVLKETINFFTNINSFLNNQKLGKIMVIVREGLFYEHIIEISLHSNFEHYILLVYLILRVFFSFTVETFTKYFVF